MDHNTKLELAILIAELNNFLLEIEFKGDQMLKAAKLVERAGIAFAVLREGAEQAEQPLAINETEESVGNV